MATSIAIQQEALTRARSSQSLGNFATIIRGFMAKGLAESEISPRENVFTYNAWKALGRQVKKGEHGVRCLTFIMQRNKRTGREEKRPWSTTVFHISQTEPVGTQHAPTPAADIDNPFRDNSPSRSHYALPAPPADEPDATAENIPYAGEAELDTPELQAHSEAVHSGRQCPVHISNGPMDCEYCTKIADMKNEPEVIPAPAPKDSAYDRAMRGETVSIMDMIEEMKDSPKPTQDREATRLQRLSDKYGPNGAARIASKSFQTKTVDF